MRPCRNSREAAGPTTTRAMSDKKLIVFGASGHAKVVIDIARSCGYEPAAVLDDNAARHGQDFAGAPVLGGRDALAGLIKNGLTSAVVAIGDNRVRTLVA